jgi:hypothetical protein
MRTKFVPSGLALAFVALSCATGVAGQAAMHVGHVAAAFGDTPNGQGLLPTAVAEAQVANQHAQFAAKDLTDLAAMKMHTQHVLNAIDPTVVPKGPGAGYGVKKAAQGVVQHIKAAAASSDASDNVKTHATHIATAAQNVVTWSDQIVQLGQQIDASTSASQAAPLVQQMQKLTAAIVSGTDANGDGRIGWQEGEGGLAQATQHMALLERGEGATAN